MSRHKQSLKLSPETMRRAARLLDSCRKRHFSTIALLLFLVSRVDASPGLAALGQGSNVSGFTTLALYVDDDGRPFGARFAHDSSGFTLDYLVMETSPGYFIWVNSWPTSDMGEPHTQEHLLLGKGNKGRATSSLRNMLLIESSAYTMQWRTCYHAQTAAGPEAFFTGLRAELDAMLHPDYTDEEIRREVCNIGVAEDPDGRLRLEEKGTVYNEMVSSFERGWSRMGRALDMAIYGPRHPLAYVSGGLPAAIRVMKPGDIRKFHADNYRLGNMGMIVALPSSMELEKTLSTIDGTLRELSGPWPGLSIRGGHIRPQGDLSYSEPIGGATLIADYPNANANNPGPVLMAWSSALPLSLDDEIALRLFMSAVAGDASTDLYRRLVDAQSRTLHTGATTVFGWVSNDEKNPVYIGLGNVDPAWMTQEGLGQIRAEVMEEVQRIADLPDESDELIAFNNRIATRIVEARRDGKKFLGTPPGFGFRHASSAWMETLRQLERVDTFRKSPTMAPHYDTIEAMVKGGKNIWRAMLQRAGVLGKVPHIASARPSPDLLAREAEERRERLANEVRNLMHRYRTADEQDAIRRYRMDYDSTTRVLDSISARAPMPRFVDTPPMSIDDDLTFTRSELPKGITITASTFEQMSGGTVGIALRMDDVLPKHYLYLSALPALLSQSGLVVDGVSIPYAEAQERVRREIQGVNIYVNANAERRRYELVARGSGLTERESASAIDWIGLLLYKADWRRENLPRLREIVDQSLKNLRTTMQGSEEGWVNDPAAAWRRQRDRLFLATSSFLTREHNLFRLRWLLKSTERIDDTAALGSAFEMLAGSGVGSKRGAVDILLRLVVEEKGIERAPRRLQQIVTAVEALSPEARDVIAEGARDVRERLSDIPDDALEVDIRYLFLQMRSDLMTDPDDVLAELEFVRQSLLKSERARFFAIGSTKTLNALQGKISALASSLSSTPPLGLPRGTSPLISERIARRRPGRPAPLFVGLVNPSTSSGVFVNSAPAPDYRASDTGALIDILAGMIYGGHGAHSIFMKTWGAGLAYSNGIRASLRSGLVNYYAERCPSLPQTLGFVIDELRNAPVDRSLAEYAIAQTFDESRAGATYESRGEAMAADLADGMTPDVIRAFRKRVLDLRALPNLADRVRERLPIVCGRVLPGWGATKGNVESGSYFVIGPDTQLDLYDAYLKKTEGAGAELVRIYPSDFWMVE